MRRAAGARVRCRLCCRLDGAKVGVKVRTFGNVGRCFLEGWYCAQFSDGFVRQRCELGLYRWAVVRVRM